MSYNFSETRQHYQVFLAELKIARKTLNRSIASFIDAMKATCRQTNEPAPTSILELLDELEILDNWIVRCYHNAEQIEIPVASSIPVAVANAVPAETLGRDYEAVRHLVEAIVRERSASTPHEIEEIVNRTIIAVSGLLVLSHSVDRKALTKYMMDKYVDPQLRQETYSFLSVESTIL